MITSGTFLQGILVLLVVVKFTSRITGYENCSTQIKSIFTYHRVALLLSFHLWLLCNFLIRRIDRGILIKKIGFLHDNVKRNLGYFARCHPQTAFTEASDGSRIVHESIS